MKDKHPYQIHDTVCVHGVLDLRLRQRVFYLLILLEGYTPHLFATLLQILSYSIQFFHFLRSDMFALAYEGFV